MANKIPVISISLPEYTIDHKPDYSLGARVDQVLKDKFDVSRILVRAISSSDHPNYTRDELVNVILQNGTDKYDPNRKGVAHEEFAPYHADIQAGPFGVDEKTGSMFGGIMRNFYENAPIDRGYSLRIDILIIYDKDQFVPAEKIEADKPSVDPRFEKFLFRFKDPEHKVKALLDVVKILA
ncbi:MAG: hypothetical protein M1484_05200 [Patescibacteria group bacterium]|nr:hypothetical protein [Patescibacteria group bacterium]MCL5432451.1 hypothetical protein [Patescibacteria group bacterium]